MQILASIFKLSANPHSSIQSCENYFLQIVFSQLSNALFVLDEFLKMVELLTFDWVSYIAGHPVSQTGMNNFFFGIESLTFAATLVLEC